MSLMYVGRQSKRERESQRKLESFAINNYYVFLARLLVIFIKIVLDNLILHFTCVTVNDDNSYHESILLSLLHV